MAVITLYSRPGCHLCEEALEVLCRVRTLHPFDLIEVDIEGDPELLALYGEKIPVVLFDDRHLSDYSVDEAGLLRQLEDVF